MGTINYRTSKYITLGVNVDDIRDSLEEDVESDEIEYEFEFVLADMYDDISNKLNDYDFRYYNVGIEYGYYEGFSILIEDNEYLEYDDEREDALKELEQLKEFLLYCANAGMVVCFPGWCTGYLDWEESIQRIQDTITERKQEIQSMKLETWVA